MSPYITTISCHVALQRFVTVSWERSHWQLAVELLARRPATCHHGIDIIAQTPRNTVVMQRDMQHTATWCDNIMIPHPSACFASTGWTETWDVVSCSCALHLPWMQALALLETMAKKAWWVLGEVFPSKLLIATLWSTSFISFPLKFTTFFVDFWSKTARSFAVTWCAAAAPLVALVVNVDGNTLCSSCSKCSSLAATGDFPYSPTCPSCSTWFVSLFLSFFWRNFIRQFYYQNYYCFLLSLKVCFHRPILQMVSECLRQHLEGINSREHGRYQARLRADYRNLAKEPLKVLQCYHGFMCWP